MRRLAGFAADHHGVFRLEHARMVGVSDRQVHAAVARGEVVRVFGEVYRFAAAPETWHGRLLAACWAGGFRSLASHRSAAALRELPGADRDVVEITCPRWRRAQHHGLIVHELKDLCFERDVMIVDGIPTASVPLTLLGLSAVRPAVVELALERAVRRNLTTLTAVDEMMERLGGRGRRGARRLRTVLAARPRDLRPSDSDMETLLFAALRRAGVALPQRQVLVHYRGKFVGQIDGGWPDARVGYEYDSDEFHTGRVATAADSARRHRLTAAGWLIVTVVKPDLRSGATLACAALDELLRQRAPQLASKTDR
jgi:hypothetical protein